MTTTLDGVIAAATEWAQGFDPVSLDDLDARVALQRRVDHKYLLPLEQFARVAAPLRETHDALEIDERRVFSYRSVYFDTPDQLCFRDHVDDRAPRFKLRTRTYVESGVCSFEVKVKREDGETAKQNLDYDSDDSERITPEARRFLDEVLREETGRVAPPELGPSLVTSFRRLTLGARDGSDRVTIDIGLRLARPGGDAACLTRDEVVVETKSEGGEGRCDRLMEEEGVERRSVSKYRLGIGALAGDDPDPPLAPRHLAAC